MSDDIRMWGDYSSSKPITQKQFAVMLDMLRDICALLEQLKNGQEQP